MGLHCLKRQRILYRLFALSHGPVDVNICFLSAVLYKNTSMPTSECATFHGMQWGR